MLQPACSCCCWHQHGSISEGCCCSTGRSSSCSYGSLDSCVCLWGFARMRECAAVRHGKGTRRFLLHVLVRGVKPRRACCAGWHLTDALQRGLKKHCVWHPGVGSQQAAWPASQHHSLQSSKRTRAPDKATQHRASATV